MLDQLVSPTDPDLAAAARNLSRALIAAVPSGCDVGGVLPADRGSDGSASPPLDGLADVWRAPVARRELSRAWRWGVPLGAAGGMIHSPTLMAPLVRHDRVHDHDQTVVTLWSLEAWLRPEHLSRNSVRWQRAMLARAVRHADAIVVPTHAMAAQLADIAPLGSRIRVIAGAAEPTFERTSDAPGRVRSLGLPREYVAVIGSEADPESLLPIVKTAADLDLDVAIIESERGGAAAIESRTGDAAHPGERRHLLSGADAADRAAILDGARAVVAPSAGLTYPWRTLEALSVGAPIVAVATPQNEELLVEAAILAPSADLGDALRRVVEDETVRRRLGVLSSDRSKAFSWRDAAHRVWQLHAEL